MWTYPNHQISPENHIQEEGLLQKQLSNSASDDNGSNKKKERDFQNSFARLLQLVTVPSQENDHIRRLSQNLIVDDIDIREYILAGIFDCRGKVSEFPAKASKSASVASLCFKSSEEALRQTTLQLALSLGIPTSCSCYHNIVEDNIRPPAVRTATTTTAAAATTTTIAHHHDSCNCCLLEFFDCNSLRSMLCRCAVKKHRKLGFSNNDQIPYRGNREIRVGFTVTPSIDAPEGNYYGFQLKDEQYFNKPPSPNSINNNNNSRNNGKQQTTWDNNCRDVFMLGSGIIAHNCYVVTRWYRPPELCLAYQEAYKGVDIWSVGCIFAELMQQPKPLRRPLFPGKDTLTQIGLILDVIGEQKEEDYRGVPNGVAYCQKIAEGKPKKNWADLPQLRHYTDPNAFDLLDKMLQFNPDKRITCEEALRHPYFKDIFDESDLIVYPKYSFKTDPIQMNEDPDYFKKLIYGMIDDFNRKNNHIECGDYIPSIKEMNTI